MSEEKTWVGAFVVVLVVLLSVWCVHGADRQVTARACIEAGLCVDSYGACDTCRGVVE